MYGGGAPPLPPGRPPELGQQVVPTELGGGKGIWENGVQLWQYLRTLVEQAALLKAVAAELEVFESVGSREIDGDVSLGSVSVPVAEEVVASDVGDVSTAAGLSVVPYGGGRIGSLALSREDSVASLESVCSRDEVLSAVQASGRGEAETLEVALELRERVAALLAPLNGALGAPGGWEHAAAAARLRSKREKIQRNRKWRKRKRQRVAEARRKEHEGFEEADRKVDEWRASEIAKSIARSKMEEMKIVAEKKAKEDTERLEAELEMALMVEKLQELRALRIQKLKKQGRFFPDEDDKFMERVRAAVEEEEQQAAAAADTSAAAAAIESAAGALKVAGQVSTALQADSDKPVEDQPEKPSEVASHVVSRKSANENVADAPISTSSARAVEEEKGRAAQEVYKLPAEFYHFYYGSQANLGTLIEVRRAWDVYLLPGGSRIPGHWIEAPTPANAVWASYLVRCSSEIDAAGKGKAEQKQKKRKKE